MSERHIKERMTAKNKPWQNMPCQNVPWQNKACLLGTFWAWHLFGKRCQTQTRLVWPEAKTRLVAWLVSQPKTRLVFKTRLVSWHVSRKTSLVFRKTRLVFRGMARFAMARFGAWQNKPRKRAKRLARFLKSHGTFWAARATARRR